ncbi:APC family permease [Streptomyces albipurpureus]|uniref:APC family permease n=1 Tax=Streptomyces albipurpureus TaxID=2897419 RepID=A0ABT0UY72_9ACTN|nr:APC family permease [Streptomyces sp. CWNU-1]MCM2393523.1 APC family permease [Streptomyces sp. CWNU-1]
MPEPSETPSRRTLTAPKITFFIIAATAPMAAMVGSVPYGFSLGTGAGVPVAYLIAGAIMFCFAAGYAAMSRRIVNAGALYAYIRAALGRVPGAAAAYLAALAYNALTIGLFAAIGYFANLILGGLSWYWYTTAAIALTALLGRRQIDLSARMLGVLMGAEIAILVVLNIGIVAHKGAAAFPAVSFEPKVALGAGLAVTLSFAFTSFAGIESAALYGEEARDPRRSVALASYWAVGIVAFLYGLTSWIAVGGVGPENVRTRADEELGDLVFNLATEYTAEWVTAIMALLMITSVLASAVALHNATSRYLYVLGRENMLPRVLGATHPKYGSPYRASAVQSVLAVLVIGAFAAAGLHPYTTLGISLITLGTVGIMVLLLGTSLAVVVYFARNPADRHWWRTVLAPVLSLLGLGAAIVLVIGHYADLTGTHSPAVNGLPVLLLVAAAGGAGRALWLRRRHPDAYQALDADAADVSPEPVER